MGEKKDRWYEMITLGIIHVYTDKAQAVLSDFNTKRNPIKGTLTYHVNLSVQHILLPKW